MSWAEGSLFNLGYQKCGGSSELEEARPVMGSLLAVWLIRDIMLQPLARLLGRL